MGKDGEKKPLKSNLGNGRKTRVVLNVYDLTPLNQYTYWFGFGIFHSGIEVHGLEYGFGAHDFSVSGVFEVEPRTCPGFIYRSSITLGHTNMPPTEFRTFVESVASEYHGDTYHLITKNCNHFTDDISRRLTGKNIPKWVNRLARAGAVCSCLLPESLQATTIKQVPDYQCMDETETVTPDERLEYAEKDEDDHDTLLPNSPTSTRNTDYVSTKEDER